MQTLGYILFAIAFSTTLFIFASMLMLALKYQDAPDTVNSTGMFEFERYDLRERH